MGDTKQNEKTGLGKIGALLEQMGITEEARKEFLTVCENWYNNKKQELQTEFDTRLDKAKKVCIEETEAHKASLSRGLKLFLENKVESIRKAAEKNAAIAESEAVVSLKKIQEVLGGLNIDGAENAQTLQAERKKNANLTAEVANLQEQMNTANAKVAKFSDIAEKSLQRQSTLEEELQTAKKCLTEAKQRLQVISEGKKDKTKKPLTEHKRPGAKPKTRKPIKENRAKKSNNTDDDISIIAEQMD